MANAVFGVTSTGQGFTLVQSQTTGESVEKAEARTVTGKVVQVNAYSKDKKVSFEAIFSSETPPTAGTSITLGGVAYLIDSVDKIESNTDFTKYSISASIKDAGTIVAYA